MTKGIVSRETARELFPAYAEFIEKHTFSDSIVNPFMWDYEKTDTHGYPTCPLKKGQVMLTFVEGQYVLAKISSVKRSPYHEADGPTIRVSNGEYSWRVDGDKYGVVVDKPQEIGIIPG